MSGYVIEYHRPTGAHRVHEFVGEDGHLDAMRYRLQLESERHDPDMEIVSVNAASLAAVKKTHSRYFLADRELLSA